MVTYSEALTQRFGYFGRRDHDSHLWNRDYNTLKPGQYSRLFADNIYKKLYIFLKGNQIYFAQNDTEMYFQSKIEDK